MHTLSHANLHLNGCKDFHYRFQNDHLLSAENVVFLRFLITSAILVAVVLRQ